MPARQMTELYDLPYQIYADDGWQLFSEYDTDFCSGIPLPAWVKVDPTGVIRYIWRAVSDFGSGYPEADQILLPLCIQASDETHRRWFAFSVRLWFNWRNTAHRGGLTMKLLDAVGNNVRLMFGRSSSSRC